MFEVIAVLADPPNLVGHMLLGTGLILGTGLVYVVWLIRRRWWLRRELALLADATD